MCAVTHLWPPLFLLACSSPCTRHLHARTTATWGICPGHVWATPGSHRTALLCCGEREHSRPCVPASVGGSSGRRQGFQGILLGGKDIEEQISSHCPCWDQSWALDKMHAFPPCFLLPNHTPEPVPHCLQQGLHFHHITPCPDIPDSSSQSGSLVVGLVLEAVVHRSDSTMVTTLYSSLTPAANQPALAHAFSP